MTMQPETAGRGRIYRSITETIGNTPIVRLDRLAKHDYDALQSIWEPRFVG